MEPIGRASIVFPQQQQQVTYAAAPVQYAAAPMQQQVTYAAAPATYAAPVQYAAPICSSCGNQVMDDSEFCRKCGTRVAAPVAYAAAPQVTYAAAPAVQSIMMAAPPQPVAVQSIMMAAPPVTTVAVQQQVQHGHNLLLDGQLILDRAVGREELIAMGRLIEVEPERAPRTIPGQMIGPLPQETPIEVQQQVMMAPPMVMSAPPVTYAAPPTGICPSCGNQLMDDAEFCRKCGTRVLHAAPAMYAAPQTVTYAAAPMEPMMTQSIVMAAPPVTYAAAPMQYAAPATYAAPVQYAAPTTSMAHTGGAVYSVAGHSHGLEQYEQQGYATEPMA